VKDEAAKSAISRRAFVGKVATGAAGVAVAWTAGVKGAQALQAPERSTGHRGESLGLGENLLFGEHEGPSGAVSAAGPLPPHAAEHTAPEATAAVQAPPPATSCWTRTTSARPRARSA